MRKSVKFAVSIPDGDFLEMEALRKKTGLTRSGFFLTALRHFRAARRKEKLLAAYMDGYRRIPENPT